jgi:hypothetical protein
MSSHQQGTCNFFAFKLAIPPSLKEFHRPSLELPQVQSRGLSGEREILHSKGQLQSDLTRFGGYPDTWGKPWKGDATDAEDKTTVSAGVPDGSRSPGA